MKHRKMKKLLALVLALCLLAGALPLSASAAQYSGTCGTNLKWEISGGTLTISGTGEMVDFQAGYQAPWDSYGNNTGTYTSVVVESGVTTIGDYAFDSDSKLTQVTLPDTLTSIGSHAFDAAGLTGITIPSGVTAIGDSAFKSCGNLAYAQLPDTLTTIGDWAFWYCGSLTDITLPESVTRIGSYAFQFSGVQSINIPGGATLGEGVFDSGKITSVELGSGITALPKDTFRSSQIQSADIPGSVKTIGNMAFYYCRGLTSLTLHEGLETIGSEAFYKCGSIPEVTIPSTCKTVGASAFYDTKVGTVTVLNPNCEIQIAYDSSGTLGVVGVTTIRGYKDSTAEAYAAKFGYAFEPLEGEPEAPVSFTDVHEGDYFYQPVLWAVENDITAGTSATTFGPGLDCFREQAMTFLWKAAGKPQPTSSYNPFTDVKPDAYYYDAVLWAVEEGITSGVSDTKFGTGSPCTRDQIMTFLYKAAGSPSVSGSNPFGDVKSGDYFYQPVLWAVRNNITVGTSATTFSPGLDCTRGQIVTFLYKHYAQ